MTTASILQPIWIPEGLYRAIPRVTSLAAVFATLLSVDNPCLPNMVMTLALTGYSAWVYFQRIQWQEA